MSLLLTKVPRRPLRGFGSAMSCRLPSLVVVHFLDLAPRPLSTEQPESTPRVSYLTTQVSTDCRIDFAVVCRVVFKVFPRRLWVELGLPRPPFTRSPNQRTVLAGGDSS